MVSSNDWKDMYCAFFKETYIFLFFIKPPMEYDSHVQYCRTVTDREEQLTEKAVACVKRTTELLIILPVIPVTLRTNISYS